MHVAVKVTKRDLQVHLEPVKSIAGTQEVGEKRKSCLADWRQLEGRGNRLFRWEDSRVAVPSAACGATSCGKGLLVGIPPAREGPLTSLS